MINERQLNGLLKQDLSGLMFPNEMRMFMRDCQNTLKIVKIAKENTMKLLEEANERANAWERTYTDLTKMVQEHASILEILRVENQLNAQIIAEWEQRLKEEASAKNVD